tara:strand:+ start:738 stop:1361 length:624 start_codon:yes stop_codon:yes gene_type:complete
MSAPARIAVVNLMKMELPTGDVCLTDGGMMVWGGDSYLPGHATFGTLVGAEALTEGVGDSLPGVTISFYPDALAAPSDLSQPGFQGSSVRFWQADYSVDLGTVIGSPDLIFDGLIDATRLRIGRETRELQIDLISAAERLLLRNEGNSMSPVFHKSVWPGELGHDNATGLQIPVAWGVDAPARSSSATAPYYGGWGFPYSYRFDGLR